MILIPYLQFRSNSLISYNLVERGNRPRSLNSYNTEKMLKAETYSGFLKAGAKKRLIKSIELLVQIAKEKTVITTGGRKLTFKLNFTTLTIHSPDRMISAAEAHKTCLEPYLQWLRRNYNCQCYIWKAELQKRGQIHYHITSDTYVPHKELRKKWNELQKKAGYLDYYYANIGIYKRKDKWNAPSTEIKAQKYLKNLVGYLTKEFTKTYQNNKSVKGKVWDCSKNLKTSSLFTTMLDTRYENKINALVKSGVIKAVQTDHCTIYKMDGSPAALLSDTDKVDYNNLMSFIRSRDLPKVKKPEKKRISFSTKLKLQYVYALPDLFCNSKEPEKMLFSSS